MHQKNQLFFKYFLSPCKDMYYTWNYGKISYLSKEIYTRGFCMYHFAFCMYHFAFYMFNLIKNSTLIIQNYSP